MKTDRDPIGQAVVGLRSAASSGPNCGSATPADARDRHLLLAALAEIEALAELDESLENAPDPGLAALVRVGIPYRPDGWFGETLCPACRKACSRALRRLERAGLMRLLTEPRRNRVTHVQLTPTGIRRAIELAGDATDRVAIIEGLQRTAWGADLAAEVWKTIWPKRRG
jgi:hypothetical protein